ncbi:MAG: hypothetical protein GC168_03440 [Candidatus Hydrogenedens sp.]|nr:hypothetical protein [Candidatus Hydrogenedens sp.]
MRRAILLVGLLAATWNVSAEGVDAERVISEQLKLSSADAAAYWDGLSWTVVSLVAQGQRVALDGLGAFEPAYANGGPTGVKRTLRFEFDLGPTIEQPGMKSVFDDEFIQALSSFAWLKETGAKVERRLTGDEWSKLLDIFVFCVLRNADGQSRQPLGLGLGSFYPTAEVDLSVQRDKDERRVVIDFVAEDDSPEKFAWQYDLSVTSLDKMTTALLNQAANLYRFERVTRIREYGDAARAVSAVADAWVDELDDLTGGTKAQDHNSSRSNKTASIIADGLGGLDDALNLIKAAAAQDHNSSRSNKTASVIDNVGDGGGWTSETLNQKAQDHNSSRSNKTASKNADFYNDLTSRYDGAYTTRAQDHNSSRSNKTASIIVDFDPSPDLDALFERVAGF